MMPIDQAEKKLIQALKGSNDAGLVSAIRNYKRMLPQIWAEMRKVNTNNPICVECKARHSMDEYNICFPCWDTEQI